jgi:hypothetical protein
LVWNNTEKVEMLPKRRVGTRVLAAYHDT